MNDNIIFLVKDLEKTIRECLEKNKDTVEHAHMLNAPKQEIFKVLYDKVFEYLSDFEVQFAMSEIDNHVKIQIDLFLSNYGEYEERVEAASSNESRSIRKFLFGSRKRVFLSIFLIVAILTTLLNFIDNQIVDDESYT